MKYTITLLTVVSIFSIGCFQERIELDLNEDNTKIAIEAWITDLDDIQTVTVTQTANYLGDTQNEFVSGAVVFLEDETGQSYELTEGDAGHYTLPREWEARLGDNYTLTISVDNEEYSATHRMRATPFIEDLIIDDVFNEEDSLIGYETVFALQEIPGKGDAYYVIDYKKGTAFGDTLLNGGYANDEFFDGEFIEDIRLTEEDRLFQIGDTAVVEVFSIGRETANFLLDVEQEIFRGGPFDPPAANVRSNFSGGAVGYFIISGADRKEIIVE